MNVRAILSPVDFSEHSRHALRWAGAFAARFHCRLTILGVVDSLLAEAARIRLGRDLAAETEPALREFVAATWPDGMDTSLQPAFETATGDSADAILDAATADGSDLIVMGTQGLGGFRKWLLGSTTERLLRRTHVPVLAVPLAAASEGAASDAGFVSRVLAATDFSDASVAAATIAAQLASAFSAQLTLAHIVEPLSVPPQWRPLVDDADETRVGASRSRLRALAGQICGDQNCDQVVAVGRAAELIGSVAAECRAQIVVMGLASDRGAFAPRPGSIAYRVLCATTIPVLVVPVAHGGKSVEVATTAVEFKRQ